MPDIDRADSWAGTHREWRGIVTEPTKRNGRTGWTAFILGLPVVAVIVYFIATGEYKAKVVRLGTDMVEVERSDRVQESRIVRLETIYERTADEIKSINNKLDRLAR